jgi:hypothetical protein
VVELTGCYILTTERTGKSDEAALPPLYALRIFG